MPNPSVPSKEQIAAAFAELLANVVPANARKNPKVLAERLEPYRESVLAQRELGYSWKQIAAVMAAPKINMKTSAKALATVFEPKTRTRSAKPKKPSPAALAIDPKTGLPEPKK
jgi:hypothetical protein